MAYFGRRLRSTPVLREMLQETCLQAQDFIMPYFVVDTADTNYCSPIASMPGQFQFSLRRLEEHVALAVDAGLRACLLFGIPGSKDPQGSEAYAENGIVQQALRVLKRRFPSLIVVTDVCLCEYTSHGHCGVLTETSQVSNEATLPLLARTAVSHAAAGADIVAPSDMMDQRVAALRGALDGAGFQAVPIISYAVKYASAFYGPFRDAAESAPQFGDRKTYQMNLANRLEALCEGLADLDEGADILMVKPAGFCLDIIRELRHLVHVPLAAYQVSGEYSMIKAAALNGWLDETQAILESLLSIKRAGAKLIFSYFTEELLRQRLVR